MKNELRKFGGDNAFDGSKGGDDEKDLDIVDIIMANFADLQTKGSSDEWHDIVIEFIPEGSQEPGSVPDSKPGEDEE